MEQIDLHSVEDWDKIMYWNFPMFSNRGENPHFPHYSQYLKQEAW
jgi:hypothetical protein